jgi:hypothetical protein
MCCRCGSTHRYAHSKDLEPGVRRSRAMDRQTAGAATCVLQPPLQLIPLFRQQCTFYARSNHPETWQECQAQVVRHAHSELERVVTQIALNITKTTLVVFKTLTVCADILDLHK